jgi:WD40 repeat protein
MTNQHELWQVGQTIADLYEVRGVNTEGGMSIVYFVWHKTWNTELVIKTPRPQLMKDQRSRDDFTREAETWVKLGMHPNIVTAFYVREIDGFPRIIVEKMNGGSLKEWLARGKVPDLATALDIAIQVAGGLAYAQKHQPDFVHRDLKPANVLMTPGGTAKVTDFGLAGVIGKQVGTPAYMAPEVWRESCAITSAADWYSFGVVLYELLTGRRPFDRGDKGASLGQIQGGKGVEGSLGALRDPVAAPELSQRSLGEKLDIQRVSDRSLGEVSLSSKDVTDADMAFYRNAHLNQTPRAPKELNSSIPEELNALCLELLVKDEEQRLSNAAGIIERLKAIYESSVGTTYPRPEPKEVDLAADSMNNYALSMLDLGKPEEAEKYWEEALKKHPGHLGCTYNQGVHQWRITKINDDELLRRLRESDTQSELWRKVVLQARVHLERADCEETVKLLEALGEEDRTRCEVVILLELAKENNPYSRRRVRTFEVQSKTVKSVGFSSDGRYALSGTGSCDLFGSNENTLKLWEVETGQCVRTFGELKGVVARLYKIVLRSRFVRKFGVHTESVTSVCLSPDGQYALSGGGDRLLKLWDVKTGQCFRTFEGHTNMVASVCFSPDGRHALSGSWDDTLKLWKVDTGRCTRTFEGHKDAVASVCFSPDGGYALSGGGWTLKLWEVDTGQCLRTFEGNTEAVNAVGFNRDGRYALSGSRDGKVKLWDVEKGRCVRTFEGHAYGVNSVCFSPDGRHALSGGGDRTLKLWVVETGQCVRTFEGYADGVTSVSFSPDGRYALSGGDKSLKLWAVGIDWHALPAALEVANPGTICELVSQESSLQTHLKGFDCAADISDAIRRMRDIREINVYRRHAEVVQRWQRLATQLPHTSLTDAWVVWTFQQGMSALSSDGRYAMSSLSNVPILWEIERWGRLLKLEGHKGRTQVVTFSPDGSYVLSVSNDNTLKLWEIKTGAFVRTFSGYGTDCPTAVCFSVNGRYVLSGHFYTPMKLWEVDTGQCIRTFDKNTFGVTAICFNPDGRYALSGGVTEHKLNLRDVWTGQCVRTFEGHSGNVHSVCFSPDGRYALSGSKDKTVMLWEVETGRRLRTFEGHTESVFTVCFSPDGRYALSGSWDKTVKLWEVETGRCPRTFERHTKGVLFVAFSPDGTYCYSSEGDKTIQWYLDWELEEPRTMT